MKKDITAMAYDYVRQIDNKWGDWERAREIYNKGMEELEKAYQDKDIDYMTYEHLQDVLAHVN